MNQDDTTATRPLYNISNLTPAPDTATTPASTPTAKLAPKTAEYTRARIFLFVSLPILILLFNTNTIIVSIITTMLILLSISSMFEPISNGILRHCNNLLILLGKPFEWLWRFLFVKHLSSLGRWLKRHRRPVIDLIAIIAIVILLGATTLSPFFTTARNTLSDGFCLHGWPWFSCNSGIGASILPDGVHVGLITDNPYDSHDLFDQSILSLRQDEAHLEKLIAGENQNACTGQHVTLVAATMLSRTVEDPSSSATLGLQVLQGNYLAQQSYNATKPALPLCLAIANLGTHDTADSNSKLVSGCSACYAMPQVVHQIAQFAHNDPSVRGIVGFPYSQQSTEALQIIKDSEPSLASLPIISPSASSDNLSNITRFYRADAPDQNQSGAIAQYFCSYLVPKQSSLSIAVLTDPSDAYSGDLPIDFKSDIPNCINPTKTFTISYKNGDSTGDSTSIQNAVDQAVKKDQVNYIFFPGYDADLDTVESQIYKDLPNGARTVMVIGGDGINNVDATTHYAYTRVYAASFAHPLLRTDPFANSFIKQGFSQSYEAQPTAIQPGYVWIPKDTLLAIDAVQAFTKTAQSMPTGDFAQNTFNTILQSVNVQGETGNITFQGNRVNSGHISDRTEEDVYITCYDYQHILHLVDSYSTTTDNSTITGKSSVQENTSIPNITSCY